MNSVTVLIILCVLVFLVIIELAILIALKFLQISLEKKRDSKKNNFDTGRISGAQLASGRSSQIKSPTEDSFQQIPVVSQQGNMQQAPIKQTPLQQAQITHSGSTGKVICRSCYSPIPEDAEECPVCHAKKAGGAN